MKKHFITRSFTLLELIIVIIILGILAVLAFSQYVRVIEKGRTSEAKANLATIRKMAVAEYLESGAWPGNPYIRDTLEISTDCAGDPRAANFWFEYSMQRSTLPPNSIAWYRAHRCTAGGKNPPNSGTDYYLELSTNGDVISSPPGYW